MDEGSGEQCQYAVHPLEHGIPTFCDKPLAMATRKTQEMTDLSDLCYYLPGRFIHVVGTGQEPVPVEEEVEGSMVEATEHGYERMLWSKMARRMLKGGYCGAT